MKTIYFHMKENQGCVGFNRLEATENLRSVSEKDGKTRKTRTRQTSRTTLIMSKLRGLK